MRLHGYSMVDLAGGRSFTEMLFLAMRGELPTRQERSLLDELLIALSALGPRHPAARAAMYASTTKTVYPNVVPMALGVLSGAHLGSTECVAAHAFLRRHVADDPSERARACAEAVDPRDPVRKAAPGFGTRFDGIDPLPGTFLRRFAGRAGAGQYVRWAHGFSSCLAQHGMGVLMPGLAAAVLLDLGFTPMQACGTFQLAAVPQIVALAAELGAKGMTAMPFMPQDRYHIESEEAGHG
jgi:citrate synthase